MGKFKNLFYYFALAGIMQEGNPGALRAIRELERSQTRDEEVRCASIKSQQMNSVTSVK